MTPTSRRCAGAPARAMPPCSRPSASFKRAVDARNERLALGFGMFAFGALQIAGGIPSAEAATRAAALRIFESSR